MILPPTSWIVVWMTRANLAALGESAGVLNAAALAGVLCGAKPLLVCVIRVLEERNGQAYKRYHHANGVFEEPAHSVACRTSNSTGPHSSPSAAYLAA